MDALAEYLLLVDALGRENGHDPLWWATDAASKNRVRSPLLWLLRAEEPAASGAGLPTALRTLVSEYRRLRKRIRLARELFPQAARAADPEQPVSLIKTFAYPSSFGVRGFTDPFFPGLAEHLGAHSRPGRRVLTLCLDFDDSGGVKRRMAALGDPDLLPLEAFLTSGDAVRAALTILGRLLGPGFRTPRPLAFQGRDVASGVGRSLRTGGGLPLGQYIHRQAAETLSRTHKVTHCVLTYEGNPWERMFTLGLRTANPGVEIVGSQHSAVTQASAGMFPGQAEMSLCPLPDRVLATGRTTADIILRHSSWPPDRMLACCALRYSALYALPFIPRAAGAALRVLVAPEGLDEAISLIGYAMRQARLCPETRFVIRAHPALPLETFLVRLGLDLKDYPNVEKSGLARVEQDVSRSDAVLYWGSTVCMEALMMGVPVVHFDRGDRPSYDPLFEGCALQWVVTRDAPLSKVLEELRAMPEPERFERATRARAYVESCFHPAGREQLDCFLPATGSSGRKT